MQCVDANTCWHLLTMEKSGSNVGLMSRPGEKKKWGRARKVDSPMQAVAAHSLFSTPGKHDYLALTQPPPAPPSSQLKFVTEMSANGHLPVLESCISAIWCENKCHVLCSLPDEGLLKLHLNIKSLWRYSR